MEKLSENIEDYDINEIKDFAKKYIKSRNVQIKYYESENGKEKYRACARRYYHNNRERCCNNAKERYRKKIEKTGRKVNPKRGRPNKGLKDPE